MEQHKVVHNCELKGKYDMVWYFMYKWKKKKKRVKKLSCQYLWETNLRAVYVKRLIFFIVLENSSFRLKIIFAKTSFKYFHKFSI